MSNLANNTAELRDILTAVNSLPDASGGGTTPSGTKQITQNGEYDVTAYAKANVNVPIGGGSGVVETCSLTVDVTVTPESCADIYYATVNNGKIEVAHETITGTTKTLTLLKHSVFSILFYVPDSDAYIELDCGGSVSNPYMGGGIYACTITGDGTITAREIQEW